MFTVLNVFGYRQWLALAAAVVFSFLLVFVSRHHRLNRGTAIKASEPAVLLVHDAVDLDGLLGHLRQSGVSFHEKEMLWAARIMGWHRFQRGRYVLDGYSGYADFFSKLGRGLQDPLLVRIPPGQDKSMLKVRIAAQMQFEADELAAAMKDTSFLNRHGIEAHRLYGRMLPDSYEVYWTSSPERLLERLLSEFERRVAIPYAGRMEELGRSVDEIATLASIIEWEARYDHEKPTISGLYWNRLNRRWRLQADPTVNYAKGERTRLVYADYRINHPYNTYRIHGLPPGPINNPSMASIQAALFPEEHPYMYMVARPDGTHAFSRTYAEHRARSREWTQWLREQRRIQAEMEREEVAGS